MPLPERPRILVVDDDELTIEALRRQLHLRFDVATATSGKGAIQLLMNEGPFAAIVTDLRMPGMDGVTLLYLVKQAAPRTVRILLTGHADLEAAISAVNEGNIFRLLTKPCATGVLCRALDAAAERYESGSD